jgi:hypothetical protein
MIKQGVKDKLDELVSDNVLGGATITDIRKDPLAADHPNFPHAYVMPPGIESELSDNRTLLRTYTFEVVVLFNADNIQGTTEIEEKVEAILDAFDNDPTLGGEALAGIPPVSSAPVPYQHGSSGKNLIMVVIEVAARGLVTLTHP